MVLFHNVVEILELADFNRRAVLRIVALDGGFIGRTPVDRDLLWYTMRRIALVRNRLAACSSRCSVKRKSIV